MNNIKKILSLTFVLFSVYLFAQPDKPNPPTLVNDFAAIFTPEQRTELETNLVQFSRKTSNQIVVVTVNDLEGNDPAAYAVALGEKWGVGDAKFDNGIVILVKPKTSDSKGEVFIAIGYGLEAVIPDALANRIIDVKMIPHFKENDYYTGVVEALNTMMPVAAGEISHEEVSMTKTSDIIIGVALLFFIAILSFFRGKGDSRAGTIGAAGYMAGRYSGGRSSSIGGFGGFGGGSFGGGGAGGSW